MSGTEEEQTEPTTTEEAASTETTDADADVAGDPE